MDEKPCRFGTLDATGQTQDLIHVPQAGHRVPVEWVAPKARGTGSLARLYGLGTGPVLQLHADEPRIGKLPSPLLPTYRSGPPYHQAARRFRTCFGLASRPPGRQRSMSANFA